MSTIQLDSRLTPEHEAALTAYLRGAERLTRTQWQHLREAIDLLAQSTLIVQAKNFSFAQFYETFIDRQFAETFLQTLVATEDVSQNAPRLQAATARQILQWLQQQDFYQKGQAESRWLLTYCLYWWASFALGYAFELEIFRDLQAEGIAFSCHDITLRAERLSAFDLTVLGLRGDVKYSTWFLTVEQARFEDVDFFITRLYDATQAEWRRVVLLTTVAWAALDGSAVLPVVLEDAASALPAPGLLSVGAAALVMMLYEDWSARALTPNIGRRQ